MDNLSELASQLNKADILNSLAASAVWVVLGFLAIASRRAIGLAFRWSKIEVVWRLVGLCIAALLPLYWLTERPNLFAFLGTAGALAVICYFCMQGFMRVGLIDAHLTTEKGIDYSASLKMAARSISFLGIGADKLTSLPEFSSAMERCAVGGRKVRLLLSPPENPLLATLAQRYGGNPKEFGDKVRESLRRIKKLKQSKDLDIEVRFYPTSRSRDLQQFRLMFIDDAVCLLSWTVWGNHIGRNNPQVILKNAPRKNPQVTAYRAFQDYFDALWEASSVVDLNRVR
jgi:hypothetical protein